MGSKWVRCRYINEVGLEVGLTFSYGNKEVLNDIITRYGLSKENLIEYNVYENEKLIFTLDK